ncbi:hypothetical protein [Bradyrhizobium sp. WD16]|uniref:hypothetical protein n=1 Tax=Bradyrhizobium sp. WD16 TaxID=1521768 RepID=UPI0020A5FDBF|nr:hypothetical protein [Bradyrhizobium sp. WD16]UTD28215.1 hypothetical protein DB459_16260 [Bradyrhizobium sp. WD16]
MSIAPIAQAPTPSPSAGAQPQAPETDPASRNDANSVNSSSTPSRQPPIAAVAPGVGRIVDLSA